MNRFFLKSAVKEKFTWKKWYITQQEIDEKREKILNTNFTWENIKTSLKSRIFNILNTK